MRRELLNKVRGFGRYIELSRFVYVNKRVLVMKKILILKFFTLLGSRNQSSKCRFIASLTTCDHVNCTIFIFLFFAKELRGNLYQWSSTYCPSNNLVITFETEFITVKW